jgi:hypothetical protein
MHFNKTEGEMQMCNYGSDMHQVRWLALVGLSLIFFFLVLVHFTLLGTLLVRFYRRKLKAQVNIQAYKVHTHSANNPYHQRVSEANKFRNQTKF